MRPRADPVIRQGRPFEAIGTSWQIDTAEPLGDDLAEALADRIERFDATYSRFRDDSLVARFARGPASEPFPEDASALFALYRALFDATGGAVSPFVGASLERLGYDTAYSLVQAGPAIGAPVWDDIAAWDAETRTLTTTTAVVIDVGAAGKGYLVDIVADLLHDAGHTAFTIDASGDLLHRGGIPLRVALEHPYDPRKAIGVATMTDGALCASATNRRAWGSGLHHVIDGRTGLPTNEVAATWATAPSAMVADGIATALFFTDHGILAPRFDGVESVRMFTTGLVDTSAGFPGELFT
ncbi:FAD:protein FMN transferase [Plantibacter sp. YIM 135249]|uniref:FAD:protein FMN transferase n=1 Tax=Plantibacter sp. YIM 135249 TaxID=3423918 RepID=UPI003D327445